MTDSFRPHDYARALDEIRSGRKHSHWMWYVFPQLAGLGSSAMAERFVIRSLAEADAYRRHLVLGPRLVACAEAGFRNNWDSGGQRPPTGLAGYLRERGVQEVFVCGLARDFCVKWTAEDAAAAGFRTTVL